MGAYVLLKMTESAVGSASSVRYVSVFCYVILLYSTMSNSQQSHCLHPGSPPPPPLFSSLCTVSTVLGSNPSLVTADLDFSSTLCNSDMLNGTILVLCGTALSLMSADWQGASDDVWGKKGKGDGYVHMVLRGVSLAQAGWQISLWHLCP